MEKVRKERVHDVQLLAAVARWTAEVEEAGFDNEGGVVVERKRLHDVDLDFDAVEGSCIATAKRKIEDGWEEVFRCYMTSRESSLPHLWSLSKRS